MEAMIKADDELLFLLEKKIVDALKKGDVAEARKENRKLNNLKEERRYLATVGGKR